MSRTSLLLAILLLMAAGMSGVCANGRGAALAGQSWSVSMNGTMLEIGYGSGNDFPQYAALHTEDSSFRLNYGPGSSWGTSVILFPPFWSGGYHHQEAPVIASAVPAANDLIILYSGTLLGLHVEGEVKLSPPGEDYISAEVSVETTGSVVLDNRPGEAFKPAILSSMHVAPDVWDAQDVYVEAQSFAIPEGEWISQPPIVANTFGVNGGTSAWNSNIPSVEIVLDRNMQVTGWVTPTKDPNMDNVSFWAATDQVLPSWSYRITASSKASTADTDGDTVANGGDADDDNDGCADVDETDSAFLAGGMRDPHYFWDFFDVPTGVSFLRDKAVSGLDFFAVLARFSSSGDSNTDPLSMPPPAPAYHTAYDRGSVIGQNVWNLGPANGSIAATDIFSVLGQFSHSCA